jgi:hypothetical protein
LLAVVEAVVAETVELAVVVLVVFFTTHHKH